MNDLIEKIGPFLGVAAFLGLAILAFLIFEQAREVRRLREWAGRGPERAAEAAEAAAAAAEARGEAAERPELEERGRVATWWDATRTRLAPHWASLNRRMPVDPRYLLALLAAGVVAVAVLTSGFGLFGGGDDRAEGDRRGGGEAEPEKIEVAILNATQTESEVTGEVIAGVPMLADKVAKEVVKPAGYGIGEKANAASGVAQTVIMFESEGEAAANEREATKLAEVVSAELGETETAPIVDEVRELAGDASLVVLIGSDDAEF